MATTELEERIPTGETEQLTQKFDGDRKLVLSAIEFSIGIEWLKNENGDSSKIIELDISKDHTASETGICL